MKKPDIQDAKIDSLEGRNLCQSFGDLILDIEGSSALPPAQEKNSFLASTRNRNELYSQISNCSWSNISAQFVFCMNEWAEI